MTDLFGLAERGVRAPCVVFQRPAVRGRRAAGRAPRCWAKRRRAALRYAEGRPARPALGRDLSRLIAGRSRPINPAAERSEFVYMIERAQTPRPRVRPIFVSPGQWGAKCSAWLGDCRGPGLRAPFAVIADLHVQRAGALRVSGRAPDGLVDRDCRIYQATPISAQTRKRLKRAVTQFVCAGGAERFARPGAFVAQPYQEVCCSHDKTLLVVEIAVSGLAHSALGRPLGGLLCSVYGIESANLDLLELTQPHRVALGQLGDNCLCGLVRFGGALSNEALQFVCRDSAESLACRRMTDRHLHLDEVAVCRVGGSGCGHFVPRFRPRDMQNP